MASFQVLPQELLTDIFNLSTEGEGAAGKQRARFRFGRVARAFHLAQVDATSFHISSSCEATALLAKIELETKSAAQEELKARAGRRVGTRRSLNTTAGVNHTGTVVRRLSLDISVIFDSEEIGEAVGNLIRASPGLVTLELRLKCPTRARAWTTLAKVADVAVELASLQKLVIDVEELDRALLLRILAPLKELQVLDLRTTEGYSYSTQDFTAELGRLALPNLRELNFNLDPLAHSFTDALFVALATKSTVGIRSVKIHPGQSRLSTEFLEYLIPHVANLVHFSWTPSAFKRAQVPESVQVAVLNFLGAMKSLQSIEIMTWTHTLDPADPKPSVDTKLLDTLATLPTLRNVKLRIHNGRLDEKRIIALFTACSTLKKFRIDFNGRPIWTRVQKDRVHDAARESGVVAVIHDMFVRLVSLPLTSHLF
ncbi:hypothetical protein RQP46_008062 [Phenoliferia psychrophenolica]